MRIPALADAVSIHALRFLVMWAAVSVAPLIGITGWYAGLFANVMITGLAAWFMTRRGLWRSTGMLTGWRSGAAALALLPFVFEAGSWLFPDGARHEAPGWLLWAATLLLVGLNEEMFSRGVVLSSLRTRYRPASAVAITGALFGLQHLSALVLTSRGIDDVLGNVVLSATYGFALAAFQVRYAWLWPLALIHGLADWSTILAVDLHPDWFIVLLHLAFLGYGAWLLRPPRGHDGDQHGQPGWPRTPAVTTAQGVPD